MEGIVEMVDVSEGPDEDEETVDVTEGWTDVATNDGPDEEVENVDVKEGPAEE
jgi:hypothetical protein